MADDERPLWTHSEHMAWGYKMLGNGIGLGFWLGVFLSAMVVLALSGS